MRNAALALVLIVAFVKESRAESFPGRYRSLHYNYLEVKFDEDGWTRGPLDKSGCVPYTSTKENAEVGVMDPPTRLAPLGGALYRGGVGAIVSVCRTVVEIDRKLAKVSAPPPALPRGRGLVVIRFREAQFSASGWERAPANQAGEHIYSVPAVIDDLLPSPYLSLKCPPFAMLADGDQMAEMNFYYRNTAPAGVSVMLLDDVAHLSQDFGEPRLSPPPPWSDEIVNPPEDGAEGPPAPAPVPVPASPGPFMESARPDAGASK